MAQTVGSDWGKPLPNVAHCLGSTLDMALRHGARTARDWVTRRWLPLITEMLLNVQSGYRKAHATQRGVERYSVSSWSAEKAHETKTQGLSAKL